MAGTDGTPIRSRTQPLEYRTDGQRRFQGCSSINAYQMLGKLGEGTFGEVHRARHRQDGSMVALKKILMHNEKDGFPITALREIKLLKMLLHPNILRLKEMAVEHAKVAGKVKSYMYMVTPYMDHDLSGLLENPAVRITEAQIKCYMLQLLKGVQYLHAEQILHRDMKAANLLINNKGILVIADFGLARPYDEEPPHRGSGGGEAQRDYTALVVTRWYRPPELLLGLKKYTTAIDMWGVGCVFGEMFKHKPILAGSSDLRQIQMIFELAGSPNENNMPGWTSLPGCEGVKTFAHSRGHIEQVFKDLIRSPEGIDLLKHCLLLDWRTRITAIDALEHPYFKIAPLPAQPGDIPQFEESHELDRRRFRESAALPPAPAGGTVGMGQLAGDWGHSQNGHGRRPRGGPPHAGYGGYRGPPPGPFQSHPPHDRRQPAWERRGPPPNTALPAKPPPGQSAGDWEAGGGWDASMPTGRQPRGRGPPPVPPPPGVGANMDTYIPSYGGPTERPRGYEGRRPGGGAGLDYGDGDGSGDPRDRERDRQPLRNGERGGWDYSRDHGRRRSRSPKRDRGGVYGRR